MKPSIIFLLLFFACFSFGQKIPEFKTEGKKASDFIPKGWDIIGEVKGDLNRDGLEDVAMALKDMEEDMNTDSDYVRVLVILFRLPDKSLKLSEYSTAAIMCKRCGGVYGDPFESLQIKDNELTIIHYGGSNERWAIQNVFRFSKNEWMLFKEILTTYESGNPEETTKEKIKTAIDFGSVKLKDFDVSNRL